MAKPIIWAVVLGYNHAADSIECLRSLATSRNVRLELLYADNGSAEVEFQRVCAAVPDVHVIRLAQNAGIANGFNAGIRHALRQGADYVFMVNNDTLMDPDCLQRLADAGAEHPGAGLLIPCIYYASEPQVVWSAGSRFRRLPPAIVMRQNKTAADQRYAADAEVEYSSFCTALVRASALKQTGLLDPDYSFYHQDYDLSLRLRLAGCSIRYVAAASSWHKVDRLTRPGKNNPAFWRQYGHSEAVFDRKHARFRWLTGPEHEAYLTLRAFYEGGVSGGTNFMRGLRSGRQVALHAPPAWDTGGPEPVVLR